MTAILVGSSAWTLYASVALAQPADSVIKQATRLFETGNTAAATALVRPLADTSARAATLLGRMAWQSANYKDAAKWLDAAIVRDPRHVEAYVWRGRTYVQEIETTNFLRKGAVAGRARSMFEKAVEIDPSSFEAREAKTEYLMNAPGIAGGSIDKARIEANAAKRVWPIRGALLVGRVEEKAGNAAAAEAEYRALTTSFPDSSGGWEALTVLYQSQSRWDDAFRIIDDRLRANPNDYGMLYQLGRAASLSGQRLEAGEEALRRYLARDNARKAFDGTVHYRLGAIRERRGDTQGARSEYEIAIALDPRNVAAKRALDRLRGRL
jgi:tetratricopeptide (TPR) repeat protein